MIASLLSFVGLSARTSSSWHSALPPASQVSALAWGNAHATAAAMKIANDTANARVAALDESDKALIGDYTTKQRAATDAIARLAGQLELSAADPPAPRLKQRRPLPMFRMRASITPFLSLFLISCAHCPRVLETKKMPKPTNKNRVVRISDAPPRLRGPIDDMPVTQPAPVPQQRRQAQDTRKNNDSWPPRGPIMSAAVDSISGLPTGYIYEPGPSKPSAPFLPGLSEDQLRMMWGDFEMGVPTLSKHDRTMGLLSEGFTSALQNCFADTADRWLNDREGRAAEDGTKIQDWAKSRRRELYPKIGTENRIRNWGDKAGNWLADLDETIGKVALEPMANIGGGIAAYAYPTDSWTPKPRPVDQMFADPAIRNILTGIQAQPDGTGKYKWTRVRR